MGVTGGGISINGPSGIDTASLVDQLTALEQQKVTDVQTKKDTYQIQVDAYSKLKSQLATVQTSINALNSNNSFDVFKSDSSDSSIVTLQGDVGAVEGQYDVGVFQLAASEKLISKDGFVTSQSASLSSQGVSVGNISIDGTAITIDANDTIQDLRMKINNATDASGLKLNVSASVLKMSDTDYRLILSAKNTGSKGVDYQDVTGTTLKDLGIISGSTGTAAKTITSQNAFQADFTALEAGSTITYSGTKHDGTAVNATFTKAAKATDISGFLTQIGTAFGGTATIDGSGHLVIADSTLGTSSMAIASFTSTDAPASGPSTFSMSTVSGSAVSAKQLTSNSQFDANFNALADNATIQYSGFDNSGTAVGPQTFTKAPGKTINDFLSEVGSAFGATASIVGGNLVLSDNTTGSGSQLSMDPFTVNVPVVTPANYTMATTTAGDIGVSQEVTSNAQFDANFNALADNATINYSGFDHDGNPIGPQTFTKAPGKTITDFLSEVGSAFGATASIVGGNLVLTDNTQGASSLAMDGFTLNVPSTNPTVYTMPASAPGGNASSEQLTSNGQFNTDFGNLADNSTIQFSGVDHSGAAIAPQTFTKAPGTTVNDFLTQIGTAFGATASIVGGNLVLTDTTQGTSQLALSPFTMTDASAVPPASYAFTTTTAGAQVGNKGNSAQVVQSDAAFSANFTGLGVGKSIQYSGIDHNGNAITSTYYKTAGATVNDFLTQVNKTFHGMADASVSGNSLVLTDKIQGSSQMSISSMTFEGTITPVAFTTTTVGDEGAGVLTAGKDAYFSIDGLTLNSAKNNADGYISGVTIQLHKASPTTPVQTTISRDLDQVQKKVQAVLDAYNALSKFATDETKMKDPNDKTTKAGELAGDMTVSSVVSQVRSKLMQSFGLFGGSYNSLTMMGVKSDPHSGDMSIDQTQFTKALTNNFDEIKRMFVTSGISDNKNITLGRNDKNTQSGIYTLTEPDLGMQSMNIQLGGGASTTSDPRMGDIITFSSGPAKGLSVTAAAGTIGAAGSATFTFSKGLADQLSELIDNFNDPSTGLITSHQNSLQDQMKDADTRITSLQARVNDYHDGLVKQFSAMEQALSTMKNQFSQMMSALGGSTTSTSSS